MVAIGLMVVKLVKRVNNAGKKSVKSDFLKQGKSR